MTTRLDEIEERVKRATPGPWSWDTDEGEVHADSISTRDGEPWHVIPAQKNNLGNCTDADGEFIARAREDIPYLLDQLSRAMEIVKEMALPPCELSNLDSLNSILSIRAYDFMKSLEAK